MAKLSKRKKKLKTKLILLSSTQLTEAVAFLKELSKS